MSSIMMFSSGASYTLINQIISESKTVQETIKSVAVPWEREVLQEWDVVDLLHREGMYNFEASFGGYLWWDNKFVPVGGGDNPFRDVIFAFICKPDGDVFYVEASFLSPTFRNLKFTPEYAVSNNRIFYYDGRVKDLPTTITANVTYVYEVEYSPWNSIPKYYIYPDVNGNYLIKDMNLNTVGKLNFPGNALSRFNVYDPKNNLLYGVVIDLAGVSGYQNKPQVYAGSLNSQKIIKPYVPTVFYGDHVGIPFYMSVYEGTIFLMGLYDTSNLSKYFMFFSPSESCKVMKVEGIKYECLEYFDYQCTSYTASGDTYVCSESYPPYTQAMVYLSPAYLRDFTTYLPGYVMDESYQLSLDVLFYGLAGAVYNLFSKSLGSSYTDYTTYLLSDSPVNEVRFTYKYYNFVSAGPTIQQYTYHVMFSDYVVSGYKMFMRFQDTLIQNTTTGVYSFVSSQLPDQLVNGEPSIPRDVFPRATKLLEDGTLEVYTIEVQGSSWFSVKYMLYPKK